MSIDWDYFQDVTKDQIRDYPDGHETMPTVNNIVWALRYSKTYPNFNPEDITINHNLYTHMCDIIRTQCRKHKGMPVCIALSHAYCYRFIKNLFPDEDDIELYNVDMHHDLFNDNKELDCGNWIHFVMRDYNTEVFWFNRDVSVEAYKLPKNRKDIRMYPDDLSLCDGVDFDAIFVCRSDPWIPPHLDEFFIGNLKFIFGNKKYRTYIPSQEALEPRDYKSLIRLFDDQMDKLMKGRK